jgi:SAM-dependent methyltransferase
MHGPRHLKPDASTSSHLEAPGDREPAWSFACPNCRSAVQIGDGGAHCPRCDRIYACASGIWRFLPDERLIPYEQFLREYRIVRKHQGWGKPDSTYFLALPDVTTDDPQREIWRRRRQSYQLLVEKIIEPATRRRGPLRILDLGAGNCWLAYQLTKRGHQAAAIDISVDSTDGLGAHLWYHAELEKIGRAPFTPIQAEFDELPLLGRAVDMVLFNGSLHYSKDCRVTLREASRVLSPEGALIIMDSPVYRHAWSGEQMVREREDELERVHNFRSASIPAENFLTFGRLEDLARDLGLRWKMYGQAGIVSRVVQQRRRMGGLREFAAMPVIAGYRV